MSDVIFQRNLVVDANQPGDEAYTGIALLARAAAGEAADHRVLGSHAFG